MLNSKVNIQLRQIDVAKYAETCDKCGWPARTEMTIDARYGHDWFTYCVNPKCIQFDAMELQEQRHKLELTVRQSKSYQRFRKRLWKAYIDEYHKLQAIKKLQLR